MKTGVLYLNLGTPRSPSAEDVGAYLREFLMDPYVIDFPKPLRALLVHGLIVPFRAKRSAEAYRQIWANEGSPLLTYSLKFVEALRQRLGAMPVALGMRYGSPSIAEGLTRLVDAGVTDIQVLPAYPQYALSSTETGIQAVREFLNKANSKAQARVVRHYEAQADFIHAYAQKISVSAGAFKPDFYLFSYHGLPVRHIKKLKPRCAGEKCSYEGANYSPECYRCQCYKTTAALVQKLGLKPGQFALGFQSRLTNRWIQPFTDGFYRTLPQKGVKRLLVVCPSFTADCLETLEEIGIRGREEFKKYGGEDLLQVPCVNDSPEWVSAAQNILREENLWSPV